MQAVILAAGKGKRMGYLTVSAPKAMLKVGDKTLLEYKLDALPREITEVIIIIGYKGEIIERYYGDSYKHLKITYVEQKEAAGSGDALWQAKNLLTDRFIVMAGDDLYSPESIKELLYFPLALTIKKTPSFKNAGNVISTEDGYLAMIEFDEQGKLISISQDISLYALTPDIFSYPLVQKHNGPEYGLPHTLVSIAHKLPIKIIETNFWMKINTPEDLAFADKMLGSKE